MPLLEDVKMLCNHGFSREIVVSPGDKEYKAEYFIDGDGSDTVFNLKVEDLEPKKEISKGGFCVFVKGPNF